MSKFPFVSIESIANKVAMGPFGSSIKVETFTSEGIPIISGAHLHNVKLTDGNYNFISPAHASNLKNSIVHKKDIIFTHAGNIGQVSYIPDNSKYKNYIISQRQFYLRCNERALPEYVAYYFKSRKGKFSLLANSSQVGVPSIAQPTSYLKSIRIPLPEKKVQLAIINILCSFDDKIELNRKMNETLEQMAQAVFQDWFVDFGPVKRKIEGINDPVAILGGLIPDPALAQKIANLFPDQFAENGLPEGWTIGEIGKIVSVVGGSTPSTLNTDYWCAKTDGYNWATPKDISKLDSLYLFDTDRHISQKGLDKINSGLLPVGTVLLSSRAPIGYIAVTSVPTAVNQGFIGLIPSKKMPTSMLYFWCKENMEEIKNRANGSTFMEISKKNFRPVSTILTSDEIINLYDEISNNYLNLINVNLQQNRTLAEMRDLLLPKLMSGEISVDDLEKKMGDVL